MGTACEVYQPNCVSLNFFLLKNTIEEFVRNCASVMEIAHGDDIFSYGTRYSTGTVGTFILHVANEANPE